ncbi:alkaline phosphatase family protein [Emticicia sp.]|uniref:alkaline phosphatase family protein n=1 Tax=Emticicia sp. TaxID=1930953 RepID=UPI003751CD6C
MKKTFLFLFFPCLTFAQKWQISAPAGNEQTKIDKTGKSVIPNGRFLTPRGKQIMTAPHPYGLILSPDGKTVVTANSGIVPFSISVINNILEENPQVKQIPEGAKNDKGILEACFMGLAISPDNQTVYVAGGEANKIFKYDLITGKQKGSINCAFKTYKQDFRHGYLGDMVLTKDGKMLYVVDQIGFRMVVIDIEKEKVVENIPTGRYPFGICLSSDESKIFVANVGVFEYKPFTDLDQKNLKGTAHKYPATKYNSKEMIEGNAAKGVPALGDPNAPEAFSVWAYATKLSGENKPIATIKTGFLVGQMVEDFPAVGGSSPNSVVASNEYVFVSNGNNDCVSVIDIKNNKVLKNIFLNPEPRLGNLRGIIPFGVTLSPDQKRLYVAEAGINAVAVIDVAKLEVVGHIPTAWFPSKLKVSNDGKKLIVANAKGYGSGPNAGKNFTMKQEGSYIGALMKGSVSVIDIPSDEELKQETKVVIENNFKFADSKNTKSMVQDLGIKHIVFIAKENRTYDEVFGQIAGGEGDASLARFGNNVKVSNRKATKIIPDANVMPNHIALAKRFAIADNFHCDSDVSADGHRWLVSTYPNEWCETATAASYGGKRGLRDSSVAPGNLAIYGSAGSIYAEDFNEAGSLWDHLQRNNKDFYNFGFGVEMAGAYSDSTMKYIGELYTINYPLPEPLFDKTSKVFPTYNMAIPDQFRADLFMKEFNEKWTGKGKTLPSVITLMLPNDHGTSERPHAGFPFQASYMADNDLAVGRTIEFLARTPYWKNMAIFITEDDPQGGVDHIDAHRSILQVISPYTKKDYVGKVHYSFGSIFKTFWHILGIPYLNQYDAGATDLSDMFTDKPDFTPYNAVSSDLRIFDPAKALTPFNEKFDWKAFSESEELDRTETMQKRRAEDDEEVKKKKTKKKKQ